MLFGLYHILMSRILSLLLRFPPCSPQANLKIFFPIVYIIHLVRRVYSFDPFFKDGHRFFIGPTYKDPFIGISNPPWNKGDGLYLSDITFPDIMAPLTNAYLIYLLSSREICPTTTRPIFPGILAEPNIANLP